MYWLCLGELINPLTKGFSLWVFIHCSASTQMYFSIIFLSYFHIKIVPPYNPLLHLVLNLSIQIWPLGTKLPESL